jgi:TetR/AcrR family transcriptional regulator, cholesterol catabolism regulator
MMNLKDTLFTAAFELFLKYGIKSVSMDDISRKLGISKKTIYTFVANKESLISNVLDKHLESDEEEILKITNKSIDAIDEMVNISQHILTFLCDMTPSLVFDLKKYHPELWAKVEKQHFTFIENTIHNNLVRGQKEGLYRKNFDAKIVSKLYVAKSNCIVDTDNFPIANYNRVNLFKEMISYHLHGVVSPEGFQLFQQKHKTFFNL